MLLRDQIMAHTIYRNTHVNTIEQYIRDVTEDGLKVSIKRDDQEGMLLKIQNATATYWHKTETLIFQGKRKAINECTWRLEKSKQEWKLRRRKARQQRRTEVKEQLDKRQTEMSKLLVFIIEWDSKHSAEKRKQRLINREKRREINEEKENTKERNKTLEEQGEEVLISEFKSALLAHICGKMPQCIL